MKTKLNTTLTYLCLETRSNTPSGKESGFFLCRDASRFGCEMSWIKHSLAKMSESVMFSADCLGQNGETAANSSFNPWLTDRANSLQISIGRGAGSLHAGQQNIAIGFSKWVIKMKCVMYSMYVCVRVFISNLWIFFVFFEKKRQQHKLLNNFKKCQKEPINIVFIYLFIQSFIST